MFILDIIMDRVFGPLLDLLEKRRATGKWSLTCLFPVITALGALLWWLGDRYEIILLMAFGALTAVLFGLFSIVTFIPREMESWEDTKTNTSRKASKVETNKDKTE